MFHLTHNIFDGIKLEAVNYYANTNESYARHSCYAPYTPTEVADTCDKNESEPRDPKLMEITHEIFSTEKSEAPVKEKKAKTQICKICNKTLSSASSYYVHMKQHSTNKPFSCPNCDAAFCRKPYLEVHMRVHTGERPYECEICKKRFTQKSSLNTHKRGHSGLKPFECLICLKTFTVKSYLTAHQWTHVSDSGVTCNECEMSFNNKTQYLNHMETHNQRKFECKQCPKAFAKESYLIRHLNRLHKDAISSN